MGQNLLQVCHPPPLQMRPDLQMQERFTTSPVSCVTTSQTRRDEQGEIMFKPLSIAASQEMLHNQLAGVQRIAY